MSPVGRRGHRLVVAAIAVAVVAAACSPARGGPQAPAADATIPWCHDPEGVGTPVRVVDGRAEFNVYAPRRNTVSVIVYDVGSLEREESVALERRTEAGDCDIWQGSLHVGSDAFAYRLEVDGQVMPDPWASQLDPTGRFSIHEPAPSPADRPAPLPRSNETPPLYEAHVAASTAGLPGVDDHQRCTYDGLAQTVEPLQALGVRAVHLLPITATTQVTGPGTAAVDGGACAAMAQWLPDADGRPAFHKGYDVASISALNPAYGDRAALQALVRTYHRAGIAVYLDAVFTHVAPDSLLERLDRDTYLDFNGNGRADLASATDADSSPYGPIPAMENPTVEALITGALQRLVDDVGADGLRVDGLGLLRTFERDSQQVALDILTRLQQDRPGLDVVVEALPLRTSGAVNDFYWQEDGGPSEAIAAMIQSLATHDRAGIEEALGWFRHVAAPPPSVVPARRVIFTSSHDHRPASDGPALEGDDVALLESAAAGLLALSSGRVQLAAGQECGLGAVTPRPPELLGVEASDPLDPVCEDEGLRSFVELLLAGPSDPDPSEPAVLFQEAGALVLARAGRTLVVNLDDEAHALEAPLCLETVLAGTRTAPPSNTCIDALPARSALISGRR